METIEKELLGKTIKIRKLSVGDMFKLQEIENENDAIRMFTIVSLALVEPKMTVDEIYNLEPKYINDLTEIVNISTNQE